MDCIGNRGASCRWINQNGAVDFTRLGPSIQQCKDRFLGEKLSRLARLVKEKDKGQAD